MCRVIIIAAVCIAVTMAASTTHKPHHSHAPHPSKEPNEAENFKFVYEAQSQNMIVLNGHMCYIFTLSDSEKASVHTDAGIRAIELKLLTSLSVATLTEVTKDQLDAHIAHVCGGAKTQHFYMASV